MAPKLSLQIFSAPIFLVLLTVPLSSATLGVQYYDQTCPHAENIIYQTIRIASYHNHKVPARILRMFFHDCSIRGCDASVLLDSTPGNKAEKDGPLNISLRAFYVIDDAKIKLEKACPQTVSCADILAIAARDVVAMTAGPYWNVLKGRKDGRVSRANETINLPLPSFNTSQLIQSFGNMGLGVKDLVALSGGHTLGFSHCSSFEDRLHNFSPVHDTDPSMNALFAESLKKKCPIPNRNRTAGQSLDQTKSVFDNNYYKQIISGKGVFASDQSLLNDNRTGLIVKAYANDQALFFKEFAASMIKLGNVGVLEKGEVRLNCRAVN
ncbi:peroxidase 66-like [Lycium barbarum]|uniref:peroxidase 66-like n=1 Tax=Lycium barbarum TaxID=112863 RepID=UPI00293F257C|nr:peroxidase 66-like [Lycium barbarum]